MAPEALYLNGECVARGQLGGECQKHEQCGAAEGMECQKGLCQCVSGFSPATDALTNPSKNPSQQCVRDCDKNNLSRDTTCLQKTHLGGSCFVQPQCPENSGCYRGRCMCRCGYRMTSGSKCVPLPPPTTPQPPPEPLVPVLPNQGRDLIRIFENILNGGATSRHVGFSPLIQQI
ncbi:Protein F56B3.2 b [Aphelenchoides avenae]|nr:Protein F56B3.2 b [Aphelenchus avenae]